MLSEGRWRDDTYKVAKKTKGPFNRIGTILHWDKNIVTIKSSSQGWDDNYQGTILPATDYWYTTSIQLADRSTKLKKGNFSLIRR